MKFSRGLRVTLGATLLATLLAGCGNLSKVSSAGSTDKPVFPDPGSVTFRGGSWPNLDNLRQVQAGMSKDQLYNLLGRPHFAEGLFGVREWDYLFHFHTPQGERTCQYKVLFDKDMLARGFHWKPESCAGMLDAAQSAPEVFSMKSDVLFGFGSAALTSAGVAEVRRVAQSLRDRRIDTLDVFGYTDRIGGEQANQALSRHRAEAVRRELLASGFAANQVRAAGKGASQPGTQCGGTDRKQLIACLAPDRRVEIVVNGH
ncbi:outer membrane protein assembly factor BamE [Castellaniella sp. WN]